MISRRDRKMSLIHTCVNFIQFLIPHEEVNAKTTTLLQTVLHWFEVLRIVFCGAAFV